MSRSAHSAEYRELRRQLVQLRQAAGITQQDLARLLGKPQSFVSKLETGERRIDVVEFLAVVRALGGQPHEVMRSIEQRSQTGSKRAP